MKEILRSLRNKNNYSQSAVACYLGISRQMYNKYENGSAEPSVKNIKKICELYSVSADVFFQEKKSEKSKDYFDSEELDSFSGFCAASPSVPYGNSSRRLLDELLNLLPELNFTEQISLMSKLAIMIEMQTNLKQKKLKKIPDAEYNSYLQGNEPEAFKKSSLATVREILKDDEW